MKLILYVVVPYLIGAIPFSYLIVKYISKKDLRAEGSGNLGTLNSYEVTNNKWIAVSVLGLDIIKGAMAILLAYKIYNTNPIAVLLSGIFVVVGHNWNVLLKFRGGRGLATAAGVSFITNFVPLLIWLISWLISKKALSNIHRTNCLSSVIAIITLWILPLELISKLNSVCSIDSEIIRIMFTLINILILAGHWNVRKSIWTNK